MAKPHECDDCPSVEELAAKVIATADREELEKHECGLLVVAFDTRGHVKAERIRVNDWDYARVLYDLLAAAAEKNDPTGDLVSRFRRDMRDVWGEIKKTVAGARRDRGEE